MRLPDPDEEILTVSLGDVTWCVRFAEADDGLASLRVFPETESRPNEPNVHWDLAERNFDELPEDLPIRVRTAIYQWMRKHH